MELSCENEFVVVGLEPTAPLAEGLHAIHDDQNLSIEQVSTNTGPRSAARYENFPPPP